MVSSAFDRALACTLGFEGGLADVPGDRGGRTNFGVTQRTYDAWRSTTGQEKRAVDEIADEEVHALYLSEYWMPCRCDELPGALAVAVFDMAVNSGVFAAKLTLQRALGVEADGVIGPVTLDAAAASASALLAFLKRRGAYIQDVLKVHPSDVQFLEGWINRLLDQAWKGDTDG